MRRVWIDVTVIMGWSGTFTGIQRVVYSCIKRFEADPTINLGLFVFTGSTFREVTYSSFTSALKENSTKSQSSVSRSSLLGRVRAKGFPILKRELRNTKYIGNALAGVYKAARTVYRTTSASQILLPRPTARVKGTLFSKDDTVLLIDGNWSDEGMFAAAIVKERRSIGFRLAHLINDMVAVKNPAYVAKGATDIIGDYFRRVLPSVDTLICISRSTQKDVVWFCKEENIPLTKHRHVVRLGDELENPLGPQVRGKKRPAAMGKFKKDDFILTVGTIEVRKNHHLLYYVYKLAHEQGIALPHLVIAGRKGWMAEETYRLFTSDINISEQVTILNPDDTELEWLYENCKFTVFPSFYEGWGIPIAESLSRSRVCISSNTSSMPEVGGDAAVYLSPYDPQQWVEEISTMEGARLAELNRKIDQNYHPALWQDMYKELAKACT